MEEDKYRTVNAIAEGLYKEKGSRFISFIYPVKSEEEIKSVTAGKLFPMTCPTCLSW